MKRHIRSALVISAAAAVMAGAVAGSRWTFYRASGKSPRERLAAVLAERFGWSVHARDVHFSGRPVGDCDAVVLAARAGDPKEVYLVRTKISSSGRVLWLGDPVNLSWTPRLSETEVVIHEVAGGLLVAFPVSNKGLVSVIQVIDTTGEDPEATRNWPWLHRMAAKITNWQETGRLEGLDRQTLELAKPARLQAMTFDDAGILRIRIQGPKGSNLILFDPKAKKLSSGSGLVQFSPTVRGHRPIFNWLVDTVRSFSWVGPEKIALLEVAVFWLRDEVRRLGYRVRYGTDRPPTRVTEDRTEQEMKQVARDQVTAVGRGVVGWPPARIPPILAGADPLEGRWLALPKNAIRRNPNAPEPMVQTFLHPDPARPYSTVGILLWDPRQVELRLVAGTKEPVSNTGRRGMGRIPRDARITRLLAAFNGGFQTLHGDFGMQSEGRLIREPKRWAATVATFWDGSLAMGTWEPPPPSVPSRIRDFRQNLAPLLEGDRENPLGNKYWGWAVRKYRQKVYIVRSGLCQTREGYGAYFWGNAVSMKTLAKAMQMARCRYGMQMDINFTNASVELYRVERVDRMRPRPPRHFRLGAGRLVRGLVPGAQQYGFTARSWLPGMYLSSFPRYIRTNWRDFGLLYLRPLLPGRGAAGIVWDAKKLFGTSDVFPPVAVRATMGFGEDDRDRVSVLKIDPSQVSIGEGKHSEPSLYLAATLPNAKGVMGPAVVFRRAARGLSADYLSEGRRPGPDAVAVVPGTGFGNVSTLASVRRVAALGVSPEGFVCHAVADGGSAAELEDVMARAGCSRAVVVAVPVDKGVLWMGGASGTKVRPRSDWRLFRLTRVTKPYWSELFHRGARPGQVHFGPTKGAYDLIRFARTLRDQGIDPHSREGRRLMRAKMFELSRKTLGKGMGAKGRRRHGNLNR